jgi:ribosomal protein S18 acetylase RimI-like enzyme
MTQTFEVTKAGPGDAASLIAVMDEATRYKALHGDLAWGREGNSAPRVLGAIERGEMHAVRCAGRVIGAVCIQWDDERYWGAQPPVAGYLHGLAIGHGYRGAGWGALVIEWALRHVAEQNRRWLRLDCPASNAGLCRYYEQQGFALVGRQVFVSGHVAALYQYEVRKAFSGAGIG